MKQINRKGVAEGMESRERGTKEDVQERDTYITYTKRKEGGEEGRRGGGEEGRRGGGEEGRRGAYLVQRIHFSCTLT